jgi:hypothetical protein
MKESADFAGFVRGVCGRVFRHNAKGKKEHLRDQERGGNSFAGYSLFPKHSWNSILISKEINAATFCRPPAPGARQSSPG